jgi:hypothetical protein
MSHEASRREGVHQYVADDTLPDEHYRDYRQPAAQAALARRAGSPIAVEDVARVMALLLANRSRTSARSIT